MGFSGAVDADLYEGKQLYFAEPLCNFIVDQRAVCQDAAGDAVLIAE